MTRVGLTLAYVNTNWGAQTRLERSGADAEMGLEDHPMPLGILYLAAACRQAGYSCDLKVVHVSKAGVSAEELIAPLTNDNKVLGISCMGNSLPVVLLATERIKQRDRDKFIILGGAGTAFLEREILVRFPQIDAIVSGEGEETLVEVLQALSAGAGLARIRGVHFRAGDGSIVSNPPRPLIPDLDTIPFPAVERLREVDLPPAKAATIITSRGCPYKCTFCQASRMWCSRTRLRRPEACLREIEHDIAVLGEVERIAFVDDLFTSSRARVGHFCKLLRARADVKPWGCLGRVRVLTEELLQEMREAGCQTVGFGIESGSNEVLNRLKKGFTIEEAIETVTMASKHIPHIRVYFMWGFPFESYHDFTLTLMAQQRIWEIVSRAGVVFDMGMYLLNPLPGTAIAEEYHELTPVGLDGDCCTLLWSFDGQVDAEVRELILRHPSLFPIFYAVQHAALERKRKAVGRIWDHVRERRA